MGLLSKSVKCTCGVCGKELKMKEKYAKESNYNVVCHSCAEKAISIIENNTYKMDISTRMQKMLSLTVDEAKGIIEKEENKKSIQAELSKKFVATGSGYKVNVDEHNELVEIISTKSEYYNFDMITGYEIFENGDSLTKGGLGRSIAGGALFGGVGAIVGGVTGKRRTSGIVINMDLVIYLNDSSLPMKKIPYITKEIKKKSSQYKVLVDKVKRDEALLNFICKRNDEKNTNNNASVDVANEIKKFKELLDMGAITDDEFENKKKQLLGL